MVQGDYQITAVVLLLLLLFHSLIRLENIKGTEYIIFFEYAV